MSGGRTDNVELFAFAVVSRFLGVDVQPHDDGSLPGMVDGRFSSSRGSGVVEVTTFGNPKAFELESHLARRFPHDYTIPELNRAWHVTVPIGVDPSELPDRLPEVLKRCEEAGIEAYYRLDQVPEWLQWFDERGIRLTGARGSKCPGAVDVLPDLSGGGAVPHDASALERCIADEVLRDHVVVRHIEKLTGVPEVERHLFIRVDTTSVPFAAVDIMCFRTELVPANDPPIDRGIDGLWLAARWGSPLVWLRSSGWARANVLG